MTAPPRHPFDPGDPYPESAFEGECALMVLLATPNADPTWAAKCAVSLASQWADSGERVFLGDLGFHHPRLHEELGQPNGEGISDVFLYGASLRRVARAAPEGFFFASAGTPVTDGRRVLTSTRWNLLTQGFARAGAHLVVFLPLDEPGAHDVLAHAERVLLLAGADAGDVLAAAGPAAERVAGVLSPRRVYEPPPVVFDEPPRRELDPATRPFGNFGRKPAQSGGRKVLMGAGVALVAAVVLGMLGVIPLPWSSRSGSGEGADADAVPAASTAGAPAEEGPSYFVTLGSYAEGAVARMQAETLGQQRSDILFVVSPVEVDGTVLNRLMAGPTADSAGVQLKGSLASILTREDPTTWQVRPGPLAFHLGTYPSAETATSRVTELEGLEIPAYMLKEVDASSQTSFEVWAGAYADSTEATFLRRTLDVQGIVPILVRRTGDLP